MTENELKSKDINVFSSLLTLNISNDVILKTILDVLVRQQRQGMSNEQIEEHRQWLAERFKANHESTNHLLVPAKD